MEPALLAALNWGVRKRAISSGRLTQDIRKEADDCRLTGFMHFCLFYNFDANLCSKPDILAGDDPFSKRCA